jgi:hypothetical protein
VLRSMFEKYAVPCIDWVLEGIDGDDLVSGWAGSLCVQWPQPHQ